MRLRAISAIGATIAVFGGLIQPGGRPLVAAGSSRPAAAPGRTVRVLPIGAASLGGLVVPLKRQGSSAGVLTALNKAGKPVGECPLKRTDAVADVAGFVARVTVTQRYTNPFREPIEAVYTFPLPEDAVVDDMEMRIGERVIKGDIRRREEARQIYEQAKRQGQITALLDQERPNIFTQAVANVMPGQDVSITIRYVNALKYDEGRYTFAFPMVVGPRFVPGGGYTVPGRRGEPSPGIASDDPGATSVVTDAEKITPPITPPSTRAGHDITIRVNLDTGLILDDIGSVSHAINVAREGPSRALVSLANDATIPNKDFILRYTVAGPQMQTGVLSTSVGADGYFALILQPPAAPKRAQIAPKEVVFVIDQTGSQMGEPIEKSKEAMKYAIQRLDPRDTFQVLGFTTTLNPCFPGPVPATPTNINRALAFIAPLNGAGGTDILMAAEYVLKLPDDPQRPRIICFMTDGYVGNDMQILDYIGKNRRRARMFPFGIGSSVNRFLIEGMAREGRGQAEFVTLGESGPAAAERFYRRIQNPVLLDPSVDFHGLPVEDVYPRHIPDVFSHGPIIVTGRFTGAAEGDVTVRGLYAGKPWEQAVQVRFAENDGRNGAIRSLWARARLDDLQAQDWLGAQTGRPNPGLKEQIIETALQNRLMSQYTSFVAVEKKVVNQGGAQRTVDVPVEMPEGVAYEGIFHLDDESSGDSGSGFGGAHGAALMFHVLRDVATSPPIEARSEAPTPGALIGRPSTAVPAPGDIPRMRIGQKGRPPSERRRSAHEDKLAEPLRNLTEALKTKGRNGNLNVAGLPAVVKGRVRVEIAVNAWPANLAARLKALGFTREKKTGVVLTGTLPVAQLDALAAEAWVREVTPAR